MRVQLSPDCTLSPCKQKHVDDVLRHSLVEAEPASLVRGGLLESRSQMSRRGPTPSKNMIEVAFKNYLTHQSEASFPPSNFLRSTGRQKEMPKRNPPAPQLHVLAESCPAELHPTLAGKEPGEVNVVFYKRFGNYKSHRDHQFIRYRFPNTKLSLSPKSKALSRGGSRPSTAPTKFPRHERDFVSSELSSFEKKNGLLKPISTPGQGQDDFSVVAKLAFAAHASRGFLLAKLHNSLTLCEAKSLFAGAQVGKEDFFRVMAKHLGSEYKYVQASLKDLYSVLSSISYKQETHLEGTLQKEVWVLSCHYLWRRHYGDNQALFKLLHAALDLRSRAMQDSRTYVTRAEIQIMISAYRAKKSASLALLRDIDLHLVSKLTWENNQALYSQYLTLLYEHPPLRDAFIGHNDKAYCHVPE